SLTVSSPRALAVARTRVTIENETLTVAPFRGRRSARVPMVDGLRRSDQIRKTCVTRRRGGPRARSSRAAVGVRRASACARLRSAHERTGSAGCTVSDSGIADAIAGGWDERISQHAGVAEAGRPGSPGQQHSGRTTWSRRQRYDAEADVRPATTRTQARTAVT